ncbi:MAG TPA: histidine ammonia-lyase [Thermotogota bacterium]|nr:histidine ammonia-lyase [Thermotogota bacterium]HNT94504.1 histidine ammonia-lyase [Thermotogota bacterium]HOZ11157.1 histidine ammonia-lyase [Thermotogota bacterium]HPH09255.1 histidine ammonia-lyase [Thermotogota bacterium]HPM20545.1 histidine ammonia-lyase [Thermotogota bacterium]
MITIRGSELTLNDYVQVAIAGETVEISPSCFALINKSARAVESIVQSEDTVYGINTGFGALATVKISPEKTKELQKNIILSHAAGVGEPAPKEVVRGLMLFRANSLSKGFSGIRLQTVQQLIDLLNAQITPVVPQQGSVGASGDLAPLAHVAMAMLGEGEVWYRGERVPALFALKETGIAPLEPIQKEGLALLNGTQYIASLLSYGLYKAFRLFDWSLVAASASVDSLKGSTDPFDPRIHEVRNHPGQGIVAKKIRGYLKDSEIRKSHEHCSKVQDAYSLRAIPQVLGAVYDTLLYAKSVLEREINSVTDNPLVFGEEVLSGGNFHGEPVAFIGDFCAIAMSELGGISERRIDRMVNPLVSALPAFLARGESGLNSGYMLWQYTAAALASENKTLSFPASVDSIPTSAYQEDHVSMGPIAARKLLSIIENDTKIVAIELMVALRALEFLAPLQSGSALIKTLEPLYGLLSPYQGDRFFGDDFERIYRYISENEVPIKDLADY